MRGVQLVAKLQRPSVSSHSSSKDPFDRGEIVLVRASAMRAFEEAATKHMEHFEQLRDKVSSRSYTLTLYSKTDQRPNFRPAIIKGLRPDVGMTEVYLLATFAQTPYEELYEHTRDLVVPVANRKFSDEELPVESIRTQPMWPFRFEYVITKSIFVSEVEHWYPDHINRYWVKNQDLKKLGAISTEQIRKLTAKLLKYEGGANEWLKDIRREARKVSLKERDVETLTEKSIQVKRSKKVCELSEVGTILYVALIRTELEILARILDLHESIFFEERCIKSGNLLDFLECRAHSSTDEVNLKKRQW
ncbi:hypothetical protein VKT23_004716 [Stygiomarasmius scandens]|uniref:Uncharacterized protein n=1 Tax=Marasmiellus scandens TaxID=2682957 RepID=A0ABR1JWS9_9AGAR